MKKRLESIVTVGDGDELYPSFFDDVLFAIPHVIDYRVTVLRQHGNDCLRFTIEMIAENADTVAFIKKQLRSIPLIAKNLATGKMPEPTVAICRWGTLDAVDRAKKMIVDRR